VCCSDGSTTSLHLEVTPAGLSLTKDRLLLVVCENLKEDRSLRFYRYITSEGGEQGLVEVVERRIERLPFERYLLQAAEISEGKFAISQVHKSTKVHQIFVVDAEGLEVIKVDSFLQIVM
jgi:hypothetical protein